MIEGFLKNIPKSKRKRIIFSRTYLYNLRKKKGVLKCHYCNNKNLLIQMNSFIKIKSEFMATIDHILPISKGGNMYDIGNIVVCCSKCNSEKGNMDYLEFKKLKENGNI